MVIDDNDDSDDDVDDDDLCIPPLGPYLWKVHLVTRGKTFSIIMIIMMMMIMIMIMMMMIHHKSILCLTMMFKAVSVYEGAVVLSISISIKYSLPDSNFVIGGFFSSM